MYTRSFSIVVLFCVVTATKAQDFISRGKLTFEIKRNNKQLYASMGNNDFISSLPQFDISTGTLLFSWESSLYTLVRGNISIFSNNTPNIVYTNLSKKQTVIQKGFLMQENIIYTDSIKPIKWHITNETRKIIGFDCRKAVGVIFDSVYVVAFYAPEFIPQGGPEMFTGLPGMILGLAIPRSFTTWFATKLEVANVDESLIAPPTSKKVKQMSKKEAAEVLFKKLKASSFKSEEKVPEDIEKKWFVGYTL